ncbi:MAG: PIN domain-containing protein [Deltaproteobacteria bacterium]|nr:PIN domain-containing protein [Deltaproteobacteria bacterium]
MRAYLDSSVVLRVVLGEPGRLVAWSRVTAAVTSEITRVECLRSLDRLRLAGEMNDRELARRRATLLGLLDGCELVRVNRVVLDRAAEPFPTLVRTLDALHLSSALLLHRRSPALRFATHDVDLGTAALAVGLSVIGNP